jgi:3-hydroxyisobutyrate dehydrogenase-like beta-hydroxyacid dehydrogenase
MSSNPTQHVGYVGLGTMGAPIAANLIKAGLTVTVWNRTRAKTDALAARGARVADSLAELGRSGCAVVFLNVNDGPAVRDVLFGSGRLAENLAPGTVVIDNSTIAAHEAQAIAAELKERGIDFLDAPVSGGASGAAAGTLSIMVGGDVAVFGRCLPLLQVIGRTITHLGPVGMGQACKACNQVAVAVTLLGVCEAAALARKLGVDAAKLLEVLGGGGAASQQLKNYGAKIFAGDLQPGFMVKLMLKDLGIARESANARALPLAGTALAENYLRAVAANGGAELGTQAMSRVLEQLGGFRFTGEPS